MKRVPIGIDSFKELRLQDYYYVDKTRFISKFLDAGEKVTLITRPRRFGKTLAVDTVRTFLDSSEDTHELFEGLDIMNTEYANWINSAPVLFFTFKDCKNSRELIIDYIKRAIYNEYRRYFWLQDRINNEDDRGLWSEMRSVLQDGEKLSIPATGLSIKVLCDLINKYTGVLPYLLIDEYDTPMISAYECGCYQELRPLFSALYGTTLKGNPYMSKALLTGINRIAKENIFSGLNNLYVDTIDKKSEYSDCFGFTESETAMLLESAGMSLTPEVKAYYDGYRLGGGIEIYNPWSIISYIRSKELTDYWVNTGGNVLLIDGIRNVEDDAVTEDDRFGTNFNNLMINGYVDVEVDLEASSFEDSSPDALWGLFVNSGYLTFDEDQSNVESMPSSYRRLRMVNKETTTALKKLVLQNMGTREKSLQNIISPLVISQNVEVFLSAYRNFLLGLPSYYDLVSENSYHLILLMMCATMSYRYKISSNRENGCGRFDILLKAKNPEDFSTIIELKYIKGLRRDNPKYESLLTAESNTALQQIKDQSYCTGLHGRVLMLGLAHAGKDCMASYEIMDIPGTASAGDQTHLDW